MKSVIDDVMADGKASLRAIAGELNAMGLPQSSLKGVMTVAERIRENVENMKIEHLEATLNNTDFVNPLHPICLILRDWVQLKIDKKQLFKVALSHAPAALSRWCNSIAFAFSIH